jgi:hypothetical protein
MSDKDRQRQQTEAKAQAVKKARDDRSNRKVQAEQKKNK